MNSRKTMTLALLASVLPLTVHATDAPPAGIRAEIQRDLEQARRDMRVDLAQERVKLDHENLALGNHWGNGKLANPASRKSLPTGEITPRGEFLVDGKTVATNSAQRKELLLYRGLVIDIAKAGIGIGEQAATAAIDAVDVSLSSLIFGGLTGGLERRIENTTKRSLAPLAEQMCGRLPEVWESQQRLASSLPEFRPYATMTRADVDDCKRDIHKELSADRASKPRESQQ